MNLDNATYDSFVKHIPDDILLKGGAIKLSLLDIQWQLGDFANEIYLSMHANGMKISKWDACAFVSDFIDGERSVNSIKLYASVAEFYPLKQRAQFSELPFSHFSYAMGKSKISQYTAQEILEESANKKSLYGSPTSVSSLDKTFSNTAPPPKPFTPVQLPQDEELNNQLDLSDVDELLQRIMRIIPQLAQNYPHLSQPIAQIASILSNISSQVRQNIKVDNIVV